MPYFPIISALLLILLGTPSFCQPTAQAPPAAPAPDVRVDFFGAEKGYAVGGSDVTMLCVLRNIGNGPLAANSLRVRCYALIGFDYTEGELTPLVPPLQPKQAVAFRWRLQPIDRTTALVASVLLMKVEEKPAAATARPASAPGSPPQNNAPNSQAVAYIPKAVLAVVPHISGSTPDIVGFTVPRATVGDNIARVGNDRLTLTISQVQGPSAFGLLAAKSLDGWDYVGVAFPLVDIRASIDGQSPWRSGFRWTHSEVHNEPGTGTLDIYGFCGDDWEAQLTFESHKDSGVINGMLRLKARKTCRLFGVQLPRLVSPSDRSYPIPSADGSPNLILTTPTGDEADNLAATHKGKVTSGIAWPSRPPLPDWLPFPLPPGDSDHTIQSGMQWVGGDRGEVVLPGGIIDFSFHLFAASPSDTARDAHRFAIP